jgi:FlaA1/EpsC-like NDP-sugar epimerase
MDGKTILIFGGSGSLGNAIVRHKVNNNRIIIYSRDESKHWSMEQEYKHKGCNLSFVIGDIRDKEKVRETIQLVKPNIIIIAAAMKHVDRCEFETHESIMTNIIGIKNILECIPYDAQHIETVCFISTDKACSPTNVYGMCKGISEAMVIEKAQKYPNTKYIIVRYGNVLNSRGSIIPLLHKIGQDPCSTSFILTDERMTRFIMTLDESVALIEHAINHANSGEVVIPSLKSMYIKDLLEIFSEIYQKDIRITDKRPGEKLHETLISCIQAERLRSDNSGYLYIQPMFQSCIANASNDLRDYSSNMNIMTKESLKHLLEMKTYLDI